MTIVTAASSNHFRCLNNLLYTISLFEPDTRTIVFDLGLTRREHAAIAADHVIQLRRFDFDRYPDWVRLAPHGDKGRRSGAYAWKASIVYEVLAEFPGPVLWLDAGDLVLRRLDRIRQVLRRDGVYSPRSPGTLGDWTDPRTLRFMDAPNRYTTLPNRNGAVIGITQRVFGLAETWVAYCLERDCIEPPGVRAQRHRYDQSILSVLMYRRQDATGCLLEDKKLDISLHNDGLELVACRSPFHGYNPAPPKIPAACLRTMRPVNRA